MLAENLVDMHYSKTVDVDSKIKDDETVNNQMVNTIGTSNLDIWLFITYVYFLFITVKFTVCLTATQLDKVESDIDFSIRSADDIVSFFGVELTMCIYSARMWLLHVVF